MISFRHIQVRLQKNKNKNNLREKADKLRGKRNRLTEGFWTTLVEDEIKQNILKGWENMAVNIEIFAQLNYHFSVRMESKFFWIRCQPRRFTTKGHTRKKYKKIEHIKKEWILE